MATSFETLATLTHHYITKQQAAYLWSRTSYKRMELLSYWILHKITASSFRVLFRVTTGTMPWQQSIHTTYFQEEGILKNGSFCVISDCLDHNTRCMLSTDSSFSKSNELIPKWIKYYIGVMVLPVSIRITKSYVTLPTTNKFIIETEHQVLLCWFRQKVNEWVERLWLSINYVYVWRREEKRVNFFFQIAVEIFRKISLFQCLFF